MVVPGGAKERPLKQLKLTDQAAARFTSAPISQLQVPWCERRSAQQASSGASKPLCRLRELGSAHAARLTPG
jgi:hypothetical protein